MPRTVGISRVFCTVMAISIGTTAPVRAGRSTELVTLGRHGARSKYVIFGVASGADGGFVIFHLLVAKLVPGAVDAAPGSLVRIPRRCGGTAR
jgi:hypothetical protein